MRLFAIPDYLLPSPGAVFGALASGFQNNRLWPHIAVTLGETLSGFAVGSVLAITLGVALAESRTFERFVYPLLVALQATPKVALGPIILVWFGFGTLSKVVLVTLVCFFPLFVNTVNGIRRADPELLDACRAFSASRGYLLFHVKLPSAASDIFAGLQIGVALALIGAVVAEFLSAQSWCAGCSGDSSSGRSRPCIAAGGRLEQRIKLVDDVVVVINQQQRFVFIEGQAWM